MSERLKAWRRKQYASNPFWDYRTWTTATGGYVVQLGGWRVFYGRCKDCGRLVTTRRDVRNLTNSRGTGAWPSLCRPCRQAREEKHSDDARKRMARKRAERKAFQVEQFAKFGYDVPKWGGERFKTPGEWDDYLDDDYDV